LSLRPARRRTLGQSVADSLREAIYAGAIKPGEKLSEVKIAQELEVSRAPVRDALAELERDGLLTRFSNQRAAVVALTREDVEEICSLRSTLEAMAVRLAIARATEEDFARLADNIRTFEVAVEPGEAGLLDLQFHEIVVGAARHGRLLSCWQTLHSLIRFVLVQGDVLDSREFRRETLFDHGELLKCLRARDEARAVAVLEFQLASFRPLALRAFAGPDDVRPGP
jgi:DNA-binding GntR family transcriptional regulator